MTRKDYIRMLRLALEPTIRTYLTNLCHIKYKYNQRLIHIKNDKDFNIDT